MRAALLALLLAAPCAAKTRPGVDVLLSDMPAWLKGKRVALVTHPAGVTAGLQPTADALFARKDLKLVALMGPEHGVRGAQWAGDKVSDERDPVTGLPVYSLYGKTAKPTPEMLKGVDVLLYDVQDIGSRSYTYIATLAQAMEAAAEAGIPFVVLDRPNPLGGERLEGNVPPAGFQRSLVCWLPVPYVYGLTPGELARMINGEGWLANGRKADLRVVPLEGWTRATTFPETGLPWVPTSPHVPRADSAFFYAATGIVGELEVVNEGVGYPLPFELLGAPWIDGRALAAKLEGLRLPGVRFRPLAYKPFYGTGKGETLGGVQIHLTDAARAPLLSLQFHAFDALRALDPARDPFKDAAPERRAAFDRVMGGAETRERWQKGAKTAELEASWKAGLDEFRARRAPYLLYR